MRSNTAEAATATSHHNAQISILYINIDSNDCHFFSSEESRNCVICTCVFICLRTIDSKYSPNATIHFIDTREKLNGSGREERKKSEAYRTIRNCSSVCQNDFALGFSFVDFHFIFLFLHFIFGMFRFSRGFSLLC